MVLALKNPQLPKFCLNVTIFVFTLHLAMAANENAGNAPSSFSAYLTNILKQNFPKCDLYITFDLRNTKSGWVSDIISVLEESSHIQPTSVYRLESDTVLPFLPPKNLSSSICSITSCFPFFQRKYSHCSFAISSFQNGLKELAKYLQLFVTPFKSPLQNEQDHFIFILPSSSILDSFLLHPTLSVIKYKLGISWTTQSQKFLVKTICFFCQYGQPKLISLNLEAASSSITHLFPDQTRNGYGHTLKISAPPKYPFLLEIELKPGATEWSSKRGVFHFLIKSLLDHFNFTYSLFPSTGHGSGHQYPNGTWNGVVGDVLYGLADFGTSTSPNAARFPLISFTSAVVYPFVSFMLGPPRVTYSWKAIYMPFAPHLWLAVILSLIIIIVTFKLMKITQKTECALMYKHLVENISFTLIGQGLPYPYSHSARLLLAIWLLAAMILNTLYVSKIVGLLAFPMYQVQPKTFKDLVQAPDYSWGFDHSGGNLFAHFKSSSNPVFQQIFEKMEGEKDAVNCFNAALDRNFACITWAGVADYIAYRNLTMRHGRSPLNFADDITLFVACGLAMPSKTVLKANFDNVLGTVRDSGQNDKWLREDLENLRRNKVHWEKSLDNKVGGENAENEDDGPDLLGLRNLLGVFYFYVVGHVLAAGGFVFEHFNVAYKKDGRNFVKNSVFGRKQ